MVRNASSFYLLQNGDGPTNIASGASMKPVAAKQANSSDCVASASQKHPIQFQIFLFIINVVVVA